MFMGCAIATLSEMGAITSLHSTTMSSTSLLSSSSTPLSWQLAFCFHPGTEASGPVFFWSYVFYLSKFYELLDTFIMILKRRPLTFLHVFHHAIVVFFWLQYAQSLQIIALLTITLVHMPCTPTTYYAVLESSPSGRSL
ncbi:hypothetical protein L7F22_013929 [Adiantum nelumboides]|nr:hypothetical protein [Adiantum nelumboides]